MSDRDWGLIALLSLLWGGSFFLNEILLTELPVAAVVFGRVAIAALCLAPLALFRAADASGQFRWIEIIRPALILGALNNALPFGLIVWGQSEITGGLAAILNATAPLFGAILAYCLGTERLTGRRIAGILCGFFGVIVLVGPDVLSGLGASLAAQLAVLAAAACYAAGATYERRYAHLPPVFLTFGQVSAASLLLVPMLFLPGGPAVYASMSPAGWAALLAIAALSTALAYLIFFRVLASAGATNILLVTFLVPVSAIMLGAAFLGETLSWRALLGMGLIFLGLAVLDGRILRIRGRRAG